MRDAVEALLPVLAIELASRAPFESNEVVLAESRLALLPREYTSH